MAGGGAEEGPLLLPDDLLLVGGDGETIFTPAVVSSPSASIDGSVSASSISTGSEVCAASILEPALQGGIRSSGCFFFMGAERMEFFFEHFPICYDSNQLTCLSYISAPQLRLSVTLTGQVNQYLSVIMLLLVLGTSCVSSIHVSVYWRQGRLVHHTFRVS